MWRRGCAPLSAPLLRGLSTGAAKKSTGIVGLAVEPNAQPILQALLQQTLVELETVPKGAEYRSTVEAMTKERLAVLAAGGDVASIEAAIGCGQIEMLIEQAKDELRLIPSLVAGRAFDPQDGTPADEVYASFQRRGIALQRADMPMRPSRDFPLGANLDLELPEAKPDEKEGA